MSASPSSDLNRLLRLEVLVRASNPDLLVGLDTWLRLGLLSEGQVRQLAQQSLCCPLPTPVLEVPETEPPAPLTQAVQPSPVAIARENPEKFEGVWQAFQDELSVRWLLFLGLFLVVLSSAVLAATQWAYFPAAGQYGVLWGYTAIFSATSWWAARQPQLQLTAQTLQTSALLLVPLNFWAMDTFGLWDRPLEWLTVAIAGSSLSILTFSIARQRKFAPLYIALFLGSSVLHWGWAIAGVPSICVYCVAIATAVVLRFFPQPRGMRFIFFPLAVILVRALFVERLPVSELGLALGIGGWLLGSLDAFAVQRKGETTQNSELRTQNSELLWEAGEGESEEGRTSLSKIYEPIALLLLFFGWLVSLKPVFPWQAVTVSGLAGLHFFQRLQRYGKRRDLAILFPIGLQELFLVWLLFPEPARARAIATLQQLTGYIYIPWLLLSLASLAYLLGFIHFSGRFYRTGQPKLARFGERLGLGFGISIAAIGLFEPGLRSLNLFLLTLSYLLVAHRRPPARIRLIYSAHVFALLTLCSTIHWLSIVRWLFPPLNARGWATVLLVLMTIEWGLSTLQPGSSRISNLVRGERYQKFFHHLRRLWFQSCWHLGFVLAALSYFLFARALLELPGPSAQPTPIAIADRWELLWLLVPLTLTGVARARDRTERRPAAWWSTVSLLMAQGLTLWHPEARLASLGVATVIMGVNARDLRQEGAVNLHLGFALAWGAAWGWDRLLLPGKFLFAAVALLILWLFRAILLKRSGFFAKLYAKAADNWAIALGLAECTGLTAITIGSYTGWTVPNGQYALAAAIAGAAALGRCGKAPNDRAVWGANWALELSLAQIVLLWGGTTLELAIANSLVAIACFGGMEWLRQRRTPLAELTSLQLLPLFYALLGMMLRWEHFTAYTGSISLGAAFVGLGVSRRRPNWKVISYIAIALLSLGWYELILYQMLQAPKGSPADGLTVLAGVAIAIALAYRLAVCLCQRFRRSHLLQFTPAELTAIAHLHWAVGSLLMMAALSLSLESFPRLTPISLILCALLGTYAALQGRAKHEMSASSWIYVSCLEYGLAGYYARLHWTQFSIFDDWRGILFAIIAIALYLVPWQRLGWPERPWKNASFSLPAIALLPVMGDLPSLNLLSIAVFYAWIARCEREVRWSYATLALGNWAIARELERFALSDPLYYATLIGLSLLYIAWVDPHLKTPQQRRTRHSLRLLGLGIICVIALLFHSRSHFGIVPGAIGLFAIAIGLGWRVRAFLYAGTITFLLATSYQTIVLIGNYPFSKWIVCFVAGVALFCFAAKFERQREQMVAIARNWVAQLERWQ